MLDGPARKPPFAVPIVLVFGGIAVLALRGRWLAIIAVGVCFVALAIWARVKPRPRA